MVAACALGLAACVEPAQEVALPALLPFPDSAVDGGDQGVVLVDLPGGATPWAAPEPARSGWSVVQTAVVPLDVALDPATLPSWADLSVDGAVRLVDLEDGTRYPVMAELDAAPRESGHPALLVRPLQPLPDGRDIAVVLTAGVRDTSGGSVSFPWFDAVIEGAEPEGEAVRAQGWRDTVETLGTHGEDDVRLAFAFHTDRHTDPLEAVLADRAVPTVFSLDEVSTGEAVPPRTLRQVRGTYTVRSWLGSDGRIAWDGATPVAVGTDEATLLVHVPASLAGADPGSVPVWVFGHGIFANPDIYLGDDDDPSGVLELADRAGAIVVATTWRGLTSGDIAVPFGVASDIATFPRLRDHLMQGVANVAMLLDAVRDGDLLDDPAFGGLGDPDTVRYHGISLGGIEGAVLQGALGDAAPPAVLHVGGGAWSTMLERSTHWSLFEDALIDSGLTDPTQRQRVYAATQLWWDPVDPAVWADRIAGRTALWQIASADEQVPNVASWVLLRGVGAALVQPSPLEVPGLSAAAPGPVPAVSVFETGFLSSDGDNRPAEDTPAHETPRRWEGAIAQAIRFLDPDDPGVVVAPCGDRPCTQDHTGP